MKTIRLFDRNSHQYAFTATVVSATPAKAAGTIDVVLDATAFFPEGGGQYADPGTLAGLPVSDVQEKNGIITHTVALAGNTHPFAVGATVEGVLDTDTRLVRMQNHTAEHIISGIVHRLYGYRNVGFHLGDGDVTLDFDGVLTRAQLDEIEDEANRIVAACLPVTAYYPTPEELASLTYRAKLELSEDVRIVEIGAGDTLADRCACCAPHVQNTGEIGLVKLLDFIHYKGGVRIHMLAGAWALRDYRRRYADTVTVATALSVKQTEVADGFARLLDDVEEQKRQIATLRTRIEDMTVAAIRETEGNLCLVCEDLDALGMRRLLNRAVEKCGGLCGVFVGDDQSGYRFVIGRGSPGLDLKTYLPELRTALAAKCGGSSEMLQGSASVTRAEIEAYFARR